MKFDYNAERDRVWNRLQKKGSISNYKRQEDSQKYNISFRNGLIVITDKSNTTKEMTVDSFLYLWLEKLQ